MATDRHLEALVDAVHASAAFDKIPLPAILDNVVEQLNKKYHYSDLPQDKQPQFTDASAAPVPAGKKLRNKLKTLQKRRQKK